MADPIPPRDDADRVRAYLLAQAERYEPSDYWPLAMRERSRLLGLLVEFTPEQAAWRPPTGEGEEAWSAVEVAQHVLQWTENIVDVIHAFHDGRDATKLPSGHLDPDPRASLVEVRRRLVEASHRYGDVLLHVAGACDPARTTPHSRFGPLNARQYFALGRVHDADHAKQLEGLREMDGFPSGKVDRP